MNQFHIVPFSVCLTLRSLATQSTTHACVTLGCQVHRLLGYAVKFDNPDPNPIPSASSALSVEIPDSTARIANEKKLHTTVYPKSRISTFFIIRSSH